jgi:hypothetical protein
MRSSPTRSDIREITEPPAFQFIFLRAFAESVTVTTAGLLRAAIRAVITCRFTCALDRDRRTGIASSWSAQPARTSENADGVRKCRAEFTLK